MTATIALGRAIFVDVAADGMRGYIANSAVNDVSVVDLAARKVSLRFRREGPGLAKVSPDGKTVVVSNRGR